MYQTLSHDLLGRIDPGQSPRIKITLIGAGLLIPAIYFSLHGQFSLLAALMIFAVLIIAWLMDHTIAIAATFIFLFTLGDIRRIVAMAGGSPGLDPIIIVGAIFAIYLSLPLLLRVKLTDGMSKAVLALMVLMFLEMFNPRQGPVIVGVSGALFYIIPLLWFWIGRRYATDRILSTLIYKIVIPLGVVAAALGIYQTFIGFLPWEQSWIDSVKNQFLALNLGGGHIRSFGFSASSAEYGGLLLISTLFILSAVMSGRRVYGLLLPLFGTAMVLASMRGAIVKLVFAGAMMWAVRSQNKAWLPRFIFALFVGVGLLGYSVARVSSGSGGQAITKGSSAQYATSHVTQGLANPLDSKSSTAGLHWQIFVAAIGRGFTYPIGVGLGAVTLGAGKFGGDKSVSYSSEVDISDAFMTMGAPGGLLYLFVILLGIKLAFQYVRKAPITLGLPVIGLLSGSLGGWIPIGQYALGPLLWFIVGAVSMKNESPALIADQDEAIERLVTLSRPSTEFLPRKNLLKNQGGNHRS